MTEMGLPQPLKDGHSHNISEMMELAASAGSGRGGKSRRFPHKPWPAMDLVVERGEGVILIRSLAGLIPPTGTSSSPQFQEGGTDAICARSADPFCRKEITKNGFTNHADCIGTALLKLWGKKMYHRWNQSDRDTGQNPPSRPALPPGQTASGFSPESRPSFSARYTSYGLHARNLRSSATEITSAEPKRIPSFISLDMVVMGMSVLQGLQCFHKPISVIFKFRGIGSNSKADSKRLLLTELSTAFHT